jgi:hypothetical protein
MAKTSRVIELGGYEDLIYSLIELYTVSTIRAFRVKLDNKWPDKKITNLENVLLPEEMREDEVVADIGVWENEDDNCYYADVLLVSVEYPTDSIPDHLLGEEYFLEDPVFEKLPRS